ncbi:MAG TPA: hypothetical protein VN174_03710 [Candidatus Methanoperedens sp.]|nr:hypothetical protein [Candidatus Methanoperedens sp.]
MPYDPHGNELKPFSGPEVEATLYYQPAVLRMDQAQWLADMGHTVSIRGGDGKMIKLEKREAVLEPIHITSSNPEIVEFFARQAEKPKKS